MLVIKAKSNQYVKDGKIVLVYTVASSEKDAAKQKAEIAEYETSQGEYIRKDEQGNPLYFSQRACKAGDVLTKTQKGRFQVLDEDLEAIEQVIQIQMDLELLNKAMPLLVEKHSDWLKKLYIKALDEHLNLHFGLPASRQVALTLQPMINLGHLTLAGQIRPSYATRVS